EFFRLAPLTDALRNRTQLEEALILRTGLNDLVKRPSESSRPNLTGPCGQAAGIDPIEDVLSNIDDGRLVQNDHPQRAVVELALLWLGQIDETEAVQRRQLFKLIENQVVVDECFKGLYALG